MQDDPHFDEFSGQHAKGSHLKAPVRVFSGAGTPIVAIQCRITLDPEQSATVAIVSGIGETRDACLRLNEKYQDRHLTDRVFDLAGTHSRSVMRQLNVTRADARLYDRLADSIIYANAAHG